MPESEANHLLKERFILVSDDMQIERNNQTPDKLTKQPMSKIRVNFLDRSTYMYVINAIVHCHNPDN